jgi:serine/threonine protein kinase
MTYTPEYDIYKSDMFSIGFLIFELITQDDIKFYYNEAKTSYKFDRVEFDLDAVKKIYSEKFIDLMKKCLKEDPSGRISLEDAILLLNAIKKNSAQCTYCIRLHDD